MAGKPRFRVPTLEEMDKAAQQDELMSKRNLVSHDASSKSAGNAQDASSPQAKKGPRKRMLSQKALLSRMPLSRQKAAEQSKIFFTSPNKAGTSELRASKVESTPVTKGSNLTGNPLVRQRVSHFANSQSTQKAVPAALAADSITGPGSAPKDITSMWTGNALGGDRRNAQPPAQNPLPPGHRRNAQPPAQNPLPPARCRTAGPQRPPVSITAPSEQHHASAEHPAQLSLQHRAPAAAAAAVAVAAGPHRPSVSITAPSEQHHAPPAAAAAGSHRPSVSITAPSEQSARGGVASATKSASEQQEDSVRADVLPTLAKLGKTNSLVVNSRQKGNPILKFVRNVPWELGNIVPDYVMGQSNCALYLSLRYHQLHPEYIHTRLKELGRSFELRVLLVQVDIKDPHHLLKDLAKICILADCTLMVAFSAEEAGRYLETYKVYENKAAEAIMERTDSNFSVQLSDCLTRVKSVNKTDCSTLLATFGDLEGIMGASTEDLSLCPGFGPQKAKRLHDVFREPFLVSKKQRADTGDTKQ